VKERESERDREVAREKYQASKLPRVKRVSECGWERVRGVGERARG
jgi:hypothetical protein